MRYILLTLILLLCFAPTLATDYTLDEDCGLGDALRAANADLERRACPAGDGADLITLTADITLTGELPRVLTDITIDGAGYTMSGDDEFRIFYVDMGGSLTLQNIHLTEGWAHNDVSFISVWGSTDYSESGGAIIVNRGSRPELVNSHFTDITATDFDSMPPEAVYAAKIVILDGLAVSLTGSQEQAARIVAEYAMEMGGKPVSSVFGHGFKTSPPMAAFVNGVAGHVLDYEVMWHPATHATSPTLPGILALAESSGSTGRDIIAARVTGFEVQGRIRVASADLSLGGFHPPGLVGVMGSAAAGSAMLKLDIQQTRMALGIAASRAGTVSANTVTMTKSTQCGNAGRMGLEAALLAARGSNRLQLPTRAARPSGRPEPRWAGSQQTSSLSKTIGKCSRTSVPNWSW